MKRTLDANKNDNVYFGIYETSLPNKTQHISISDAVEVILHYVTPSKI